MPCTFVSSLSLRAAVDKLDLDPRERATAISSIEYIAYIETLDEDVDEDDRNPVSASTSELISPIEGDSTTPPTSASVADNTLGDYSQVRSENDRKAKSMVMSHAFCLFTKATKKLSWEVSGQVWWNAVAALNKQDHREITIKMWSEITLVAAAESFGDEIVEQLRLAWVAVNVLA